MPISVLLADDSDVLRRVIRRFHEDCKTEVELVGETSDFAATIQMLKDLRPQVLLMDLHLYNFQMPPEELRACVHPHTLLLTMSLSNDDEAKTMADEMGAIALLDKVTLTRDIIPAILGMASPN